MSSYTTSWPALTMPMSSPALVAWNKNAECMASRTTSLPRNEKLRLLMPPLVRTPGQVALDDADGLDEVLGELVVLLDAGGDREHVEVEDDVLGLESRACPRSRS